MHYVVSISDSRSGLVEYSKFSDLKFEVQIRSILQHTWAEIEHDIGYKSKKEIPKPVRRKFSQLAGLLELADDQFVQIRDELSDYESDIQEKIIESPQSVDIDSVTIVNYCNSNRNVVEMDSKVSEILGVELVDATKDSSKTHIRCLDYFGIENFYDLNIFY